MGERLQPGRIKVFPTGIFDGSAAEIVDFDPASQRLFVTNSNNNSVESST